MLRERDNLSAKQKAAVVLITLGPDASAEIIKHMTDYEAEEITVQIASLQAIAPEVRQSVMEEFYELLVAQEYTSQGGLNYAREMLSRALGSQRADELISHVESTLKENPFDFARRTDPAELLGFVQNEHPQTIALILSHLPVEQAGVVLSGLAPDLQAEVAIRIARISRTAPEVVTEVERVLRRKLSSVVTKESVAVGGLDHLVRIINRVDRSAEKVILDSLEEQAPELAEEVKNKLFLFEDIISLDNRAIQRIIRDVDTKELGLALKAASDELKNKFFSNMSERASAMLREDMEYLGPVHLREVLEAQGRIVAIIRRLEEAGEVVVVRGGGEDDIVV